MLTFNIGDYVVYAPNSTEYSHMTKFSGAIGVVHTFFTVYENTRMLDNFVRVNWIVPITNHPPSEVYYKNLELLHAVDDA